MKNSDLAISQGLKFWQLSQYFSIFRLFFVRINIALDFALKHSEMTRVGTQIDH